MNDKYIVKNCPARVDLYCYSSQNRQKFIYCQDCTDCLIKQVIEKCNIVAFAGQCDNCDGCGYYDGCGDTECGTYQANEILQLFDIEEVG